MNNKSGIRDIFQSENITRTVLNEYEVKLSMHEDGYHIVGNLLDKEGNEVGQL